MRLRMNLTVCAEPRGNGFIAVTEQDDGKQYLPDGVIAKYRFAWNETAAVDMFRLNSSCGGEWSGAVITRRDTGEDAVTRLPRDGWFTVLHIVIPVKEWFEKEVVKKASVIHTYDRVWFTDGENVWMYDCKADEVRLSNPEALRNDTLPDTDISRAEADYVSVGMIQKKLEEAWEGLFRNRMYNGGCGTDSCEAGRLLAALNLIRHYVRWGQLAEAERIIEKTGWFKGLQCNNTGRQDRREHGRCGCS